MSGNVPLTLCASERASPGMNAARSAAIVSLKPTSRSMAVFARYGCSVLSVAIARCTQSRNREAIAGNERDRHTELASQCSVEDPLGHFHAVQLHAEQSRARDCVSPHGVRRPLARVVADEQRGGERGVYSLHHLQ